MTKPTPPEISAEIINGIRTELAAIHAADITERDAAMTMAAAKQRAFEAKCRCGEQLLKAKDIWGKYGGWRKWLEDNFSLSYKTADQWMEYVTYRDRIIEAAPPEPKLPAAEESADADATPAEAAAAEAATEANEKRASHFTWRGLQAIISKEKEKEKEAEDYVPKRKPGPPRRAVTAAKKKATIDELLRELEPDEVFQALRTARYERDQLYKLGELIAAYLY
jgi:hypothetical protein